MLSSKNQNDMQGGCIMGTELTRRSFLTGLGVAGIAAAGAGLAGCAPAADLIMRWLDSMEPILIGEKSVLKSVVFWR